jgi:hypothetical protein
MKRDLVPREQMVDCWLSLARGESGQWVQYDSCEENRTPHLSPLPLTKGRGGDFALR